jgi:hypothetical protein
MAKRKINKSQKIREYLAEHPEAGPTAVANALKRYGVSVALVSAIKAKGRTGGRKGRQSKAAKRRSVRGRKGTARRTGRTEPVIAAAELIRACGGVDEAKAALDAAGRVASVLG